MASKIQTKTFIAYPNKKGEIQFAINKKFGNAVKRNRARRRLKAALATVSVENGYTIVPKQTVMDISFELLCEDISKLQ